MNGSLRRSSIATNAASPAVATIDSSTIRSDANQSLRPPSSSTICSALRPSAIVAIPNQSAWRSFDNCTGTGRIAHAIATISAIAGGLCR